MATRLPITAVLALMICTMPSTTHADRYYNPDARECHALAKVAVSVGWPRREMAEARRVFARESLCRNTAYNGKDPYGGSYCAAQLNGSNKGFFIRERIIRNDMNELRASPSKCMKAALALWKLYGWRPWAGVSSAP